MTKLIVIVGVTGNQGASVADVFVKEAGWKVRGITRDPTKASSKALVERGIEVVKGDLNDKESLVEAFKGANVVYGVTDFWALFSNPATKEALKPGEVLNKRAYDEEFQQGKNIVDAVSTIADSSLDLFVWSSLSNTKKWSKGKYQWVYHFDGKAAVVDYIQTFPQLAKKTSILQVGYYATNSLLPASTPMKAADGVYEVSNIGSGDEPFPVVNTRRDCGTFVKALVNSPPGKTLLGWGSITTWNEWTKLWSEHCGVPARYVSRSVEFFDQIMPGGLGIELGEMYAYTAEFGYDGNDPSVIHPKDVGIQDGELQSIEDFIKTTDWSVALK
ncbi:MAG: hypothetical protein M1837_001390 [Sclerophora amabilis]|nr:MAG: hypothetical protein M1837_001390 [Sclerophora amabilis]